jgi:hypothetical protein
MGDDSEKGGTTAKGEGGRVRRAEFTLRSRGWAFCKFMR